MAFVRDPMSTTGLAGAGATSIMPKQQAAAAKPAPAPQPANNQPMKATSQGVAAAAQNGGVQMPPMYTPGVNGPVVNSAIPSSISVRGSTMTPQPGQAQQVGQFVPPSIQALMPKSSELVPGGRADNMPARLFPQEQLQQGRNVEMEHTNSRDMATEIAKDHLTERPDYYTQLEKAEKAPMPSKAEVGRLFGIKTKTATDLTNEEHDIPVKWGRWRVDGPEALQDLKRYTRTRGQGGRTKASADIVPGQSLAQSLGVETPDISPRSLDAPQQSSLAMLSGGWMDNPEVKSILQQMQSAVPTQPSGPSPLTRPVPPPGVGAINIGKVPKIPGGGLLVPPSSPPQPPLGPSVPGGSVTAHQPTPAQQAGRYGSDPGGNGSTVPATPAAPAAATTSTVPPTATGPTPMPSAVSPTPASSAPTAPVGRYSHLINELQQKIPQLEARLAGMNPSSRQYMHAQKNLDAARFRVQDLGRRQHLTAEDFPTASPQTLARFTQDANRYQANANRAAGVSPSTASAPTLPKPTGSVSMSQPASPPQAPKMAHWLTKISSDTPDISPFAAAFYLGCRQQGLGASEIERAVKIASVNEAIAGELGVLLNPACPLLAATAEMTKSANMGQAFGKMFGALGKTPQLIRNFGRAAPAAGAAVQAGRAAGSLDDIASAAGQAARSTRPGNSALTLPFTLGDASRAAPSAGASTAARASRWKGTPPPKARGPQTAAGGSGAGQGPPGGPGAAAAAGGAAGGPGGGAMPQINPGAAADAAGDTSGWYSRNMPTFKRYLTDPAQAAGAYGWDRVGRPIGGGGVGYFAGNMVDQGLQMAGYEPNPWIAPVMGGLGMASQVRGMPGRNLMGTGLMSTLGVAGMGNAAASGAERVGGAFAEGAKNRLLGPGVDLTTPEGRAAAVGIKPEAIEQINNMSDPNWMSKQVESYLGPAAGRVMRAFQSGGILEGIMAGWNELTPMQKTGLLTALGSLGAGAVGMMSGYPGLGAAAGLAGLGAGGYMMYQGAGNPMSAGTPEQQQHLRSLMQTDPEFFQDVQQRPRAQQHDAMQNIMQMLQQQQAGSEMARASGQPAMAQ